MLTSVPHPPPISMDQLGSTNRLTRSATTAEVSHGHGDVAFFHWLGSRVAMNIVGSSAAASLSGPFVASGAA